MSENKTKLELQITKNILILNQIKTQPDYEGSLEYARIKTKLTEQIWLFCDELFGEENYDFFDSIPEKIEYIIKKFVPDEESTIIHYISKILKQGINQEKIKASYEEKLGGKKLSEYEIKKLRKITKAAEHYGLNPKNNDDIERLCVLTGYSEKVIKNAFLLNETTTSSLNEQYAQGKLFNLTGSFNESDYERQFKIYEKCFTTKRDWGGKDTTIYLSKIITRQLLKDLEKIEKSKMLIYDLLKNYSFADHEILKLWVEDKKLPKQFAIAEVFGRDKTDASRTLKRFKKDLEDLMKKGGLK